MLDKHSFPLFLRTKNVGFLFFCVVRGQVSSCKVQTCGGPEFSLLFQDYRLNRYPLTKPVAVREVASFVARRRTASADDGGVTMAH